MNETGVRPPILQFLRSLPGNRFQSANSTLGLPGVTSSEVNAATNRFINTGSTPTTYDAAVNITTDTKFRNLNFSYDANGRMTFAEHADHTNQQNSVYDCAGQRVQTSANGVTRTMVYDIFGQDVADYSSGMLERENIYRGGQLLATQEFNNRVNVALADNGGTAVASSTYGTNVAANANNGDRKGTNGVVWMDNSNADFTNDVIEIDFNGSKSINEIDVVTRQDDLNNPVEPSLSQTFSLYGITAFDVQYWDGTNWTTVSNGSVTGNNKVWRQFTFASVTTSKIRVVVNADADNAYSRMVEVEAWTPTNFALASNGGTAVASSTYGTNVAANANNGDRKGTSGVVWMDNSNADFTNDVIEIDFNGSKSINEIDVVTRQDDLNNPVEPSLSQTFS